MFLKRSVKTLFLKQGTQQFCKCFSFSLRLWPLFNPPLSAECPLLVNLLAFIIKIEILSLDIFSV